MILNEQEQEFLDAVKEGDSRRVLLLLGQLDSPEQLVCPKNGRNALLLAAQAGHEDVLRVLLLSSLFNCNSTDPDGFSALQLAASGGHYACAKQLIKNGANLDQADTFHGNSALHEAAWNGYSQTAAKLTRVPCDPNVTNFAGFTPLHLAAQNGHNQTARVLLFAKADVNACNNYGDTPLHTSARYGHTTIARILISSRKCNVSQSNKNGDTALHIACAMNRRKLTRILLRAGCDPNAKNKQGETARDIAERKSLSSIIHTLERPLTPQQSPTRNDTEKITKSKEAVENARPTSLPTAIALLEWKKTLHSPYGCPEYPNETDFPSINLDSLPAEPLKSGEQYYLDLAGNILKGPVCMSCVGSHCACNPPSDLERKLRSHSRKLKKRIEETKRHLDKRIELVERRLELDQCCESLRQKCNLGGADSGYSPGGPSPSLSGRISNEEGVWGADDVVLEHEC